LGKRDTESLTCYVNWFWVTFVAQDHERDPAMRKEAEHPDRGAGLFTHVRVDDIDDCYQSVLAAGMRRKAALPRARYR